MAKKWTDFTRREKVIGVLVAVFVIISISGISSAMSERSSTPISPPTTPQAASSVMTYKDIEETEPVAFSKETRDDNLLASGTNKITAVGVEGIKTKTYKTTLANGVETARELKSEIITTAPVNEVTSIGTYVAPPKKMTKDNCDPNYSGACVPTASDVDCAGGGGDGPAYVNGPVRVIGADIYGLDRDKNGVGCES